ncbi:MAG: hypothetical protein FGM24_00600 [Candidatus Kapabacteria bacterium]|nr:hypothetical protein [Candidatus Kapabacteria bacterium]
MRNLVAGAMLLCCSVVAAAQQLWNPLAVDITRTLVKDLFETNAVSYVQPMVETINATSNARFYSTAYVPASVDAPYFRVGMQGMLGFVRQDMRTFKPSIDLGSPSQDLIRDVSQYGTITFVNGSPAFSIKPTYGDTLGLATLLMKEMLLEAQKQGKLVPPPLAATLFGNMPDVQFNLPTTATLLEVLRSRADYQQLIALGGPAVDSTLGNLLDSLALPPYLTLPPGVDLSTLVAMVPQFEIGSLYGTELLLRFIPAVELDTNVGKFSFWGVGLKHSISQYFPERWFDMAVQAVYQGTSLTNTIGLTESSLEAHAKITNVNIHASKRFDDVLGIFRHIDLFAGMSYDKVDATSTYTYVLPQEIQLSLGLLPAPTVEGGKSEPTPEQPGDTRPQTSTVDATSSNIKYTFGATLQLGPARFVFDYNVGRFNIFSGGVEVAW